MSKNNEKNRGLIGVLVLILIGLLFLAYFAVDLRGLVESETFKNNLKFVKEISLGVWENFLKAPFLWLLEKIKS